MWARLSAFSVVAISLAVTAGILLQIPHVTADVFYSDFNECAAAHNPIMGDNPKRCLAPDGEVYLSQRSPASPTGAISCVRAGCSAQLCVEKNAAAETVTTCEFRAEYACYRTATCARQLNGSCGWTMDSALTLCLKHPPNPSRAVDPQLQ